LFCTPALIFRHFKKSLDTVWIGQKCFSLYKAPTGPALHCTALVVNYIIKKVNFSKKSKRRIFRRTGLGLGSTDLEGVRICTYVGIMSLLQRRKTALPGWKGMETSPLMGRQFPLT
jgi:hypothetical protein